jgi:hypothetical protein
MFFDDEKPKINLKKKRSQSVDEYKQRMRKINQEILKSYGEFGGSISRTMAMSTYLIPYSNSSSALLFPIRDLMPSQMQEIVSRYHSDKNDKITKYLFDHLVYEYKILRDSQLTDHEKTQILHLRKIIQDYLILTGSLEVLDAWRIQSIIHSLESSFNVGSLVIPPLSKKEILDLLHVLEFILFQNEDKKKMKEIQSQTNRNKKQLNRELEYLPGLGVRFNQAKADYQFLANKR